MKSLVKNTESALLTIVTLCAMYFIGSMLVSLFQSLLTSMVLDGSNGFLATLPAIAAGVKLKDAKGAENVKPLPFTFEVVQTSTGKQAYKVDFINSMERNIFYGWAKMANILLFNYEYNKDTKVQKLGLMISPESERFIKGYATITAHKAQQIGADSLEARQKAKEAKKAAKIADKATKGTAKNVGVSVASAKIEALKQMHADGLLTPIELASAIASIN